MKRLVLFALVLAVIPAFSVWSGAQGESAATAEGEQPKTLVIYIYSSWNAAPPEDMARIKAWAKESSGIDFDLRVVVDRNDYDSQVQIVLAGEQDVDTIEVNSTTQMVEYYNRGALTRLNESLDNFGPNLRRLYGDDTWRSVTLADGGEYAVPLQNHFRTADVITIRKDWREKLGMAPITTIAQYEEFMRRAMEADFDGNGIDDTIGLISHSAYWRMNLTFQYIFTETSQGQHTRDNNYLSPDGKITPNVLHPDYKNYIGKLAEWHKEGLLYQEQYGATGNAINDLVAANKIASMSSWHSSINTGWEVLLEMVPDAFYEMVDIQTAYGNDFKYAAGVPGRPQHGVVSYSPMADWAVKWFDWIISDKTNYVGTIFGEPEVDWNWVDKENNVALTTNKESGIDCPICSYSHWGWNPRGPLGSEPWMRTEWMRKQDIIGTKPYTYPPDWFIPYDFKGTLVERNAADAATLIEEGIVNIILGERPLSDWDAITAEYRKLVGDEYIRLATEQYNKLK